MSTVRPRFYHRFRQRRNSDKIGVSDKIDGTWNKRKPLFLTMYVCTFLCRDEIAYHKFHIEITSYCHELTQCSGFNILSTYRIAFGVSNFNPLT